VRANIAEGISTSRYTSIKARHLEVLRDQSKANELLMPLIGVKSFNVPTPTQHERQRHRVTAAVQLDGREVARSSNDW
jgi:hypothetical protein